MKNDPAFKFVAIVILTGVACALFAPATPNTGGDGTRVSETTKPDGKGLEVARVAPNALFGSVKSSP